MGTATQKMMNMKIKECMKSVRQAEASRVGTGGGKSFKTYVLSTDRKIR